MTSLPFRSVAVILILGSLLPVSALGQRPPSRSPVLPADRTKSGAAVLGAFSVVTSAVRGAVVTIEVDEKDVALGAVVDAEGLVVTKASEIPEGTLFCILADGSRVAGKVVAVDEDVDLGLIKIPASGLKTIEWARQPAIPGQWAITPGVGSVPEAVGIVSAPPRKIWPKQALMGVQLDRNATAARIREILPGMGAEKAGLKAGDIVLTVNDAIITSSEDLMKLLRGFREGETIRVRVRRDEEEIHASVRMMMRQVELPGRRRIDRQERMNRLGSQLSKRAEGFALALQHDTVLQPWQCGGPLLNLDGKALGLNIARAGRIASYALPAELVERKVMELKDQIQVRLKQPQETGVDPSEN